MSDFTFRIGSTNVVELRDFEARTRQRPTTAVVTVTVKDATNTNVPGAVGIAMPYVTKERLYRGVLPASIAWVDGAVYTETITATIGTDVLVKVRTGTAAPG